MNKAIARMWTESFLLAISFALLWSLYIYLFGIDPLSYTGIMMNFAATGTTLFASSFILGPLGYFFDHFDRKIAYRKQIGLVGYFSALVYAVMLLFSDLDFYYYNFTENLFTADIFFGVSAMMIFTMMAIISNITMMKKIGPKLWRSLLRLGYLAYTLLVIRAVLIEWDLWKSWWLFDAGLPPIRIILCIIAILTICMWVWMRIDYSFKKLK